jgi:hypothetical protein
MATVSTPTVSTLPLAGGDIIAAPLAGWITNLKNFVEGQNIDENNVDYTSADGIMVMAQAQTITGLKTFEDTSAAAGGIRTAAKFSHNPATGTPADNDGVDLWFLGDDDGGNQTTFAKIEVKFTDVSDTTEDANITLYNMVAGSLVATAVIDAGGVDLAAGKTFSVNGVDVGLAYANDGDNRIVTGDGSGGLNGEANLTFDGTATLEVRGPAADNGELLLSTAELTVANNDIIGQISFQAPLESSGSDAILVGAKIRAQAAGEYDATSNATDIILSTGSSEAAVDHIRLQSSGKTIMAAGDVSSLFADGTLHVHTASAGVVTAASTADDLVVEHAVEGGISILGGVTIDSHLTMGASNDNAGFDLQYNHTSGAMKWSIAGSDEALTATGARWAIRDTTNANQAIGLTINQLTQDNEILAFKSSDVAHGLTTGGLAASETNTYFSIRKGSGDLGGVTVNVLAEDAAMGNPLSFQVMGGTATTAKTTSGLGLADFVILEHNGANAMTNITADGNIFSIRARVSNSFLTRFIVDEDGDMWSVTTGQTFDAHDDLALVNNYDVIRSDMAEWNVEHEAELVRLGVLGDTVANGGMTNVTQLQRLHNGAIRQLGEQNNALQLELNEMKQQLFLLMERN